ncbi:lysophospholipase [Pedobacter sp. HMF7647]|uniref:Lysophospholipase n=1 Tax=Hufsiella arboris TaxID=2695275 RepID=A0A7K1YD04_9SPHI|nr:SGNH/GDSL hydrolase family protein [Hufsiella arboris]MXV52251.1 lysophospholipase [Hufsiella arboris]
MKKGNLLQRRIFLNRFLALCAVSAVSNNILASGMQISHDTQQAKDGLTVLFQGDSITDGNRSRNDDWNHVMGHGYAYLIASRLWFDYPKNGYHFFNRGISGNKITDLAARWQSDTISLKPDLLSVLIGINDISALLNGDHSYTAENYEKGYRDLLDETRQRLPEVRFVLCEPFVLPVGNVKEKWPQYSEEVKKRQIVVKKLSAEYNAVFVAFQSAFDKALSRAPAEYWIWDGIHPMPAGHELMAREWIAQVGKQTKMIPG